MEPITMDTANGGAKFNSDGSFDVGGLHIAANVRRDSGWQFVV